MPDPTSELPEARRREIFASLLEAQDRAKTLHEAKQQVLAEFGVTWNVVELIEREGIDKDRPPHGEGE